jgi:hypothetical protein
MQRSVKICLKTDAAALSASGEKALIAFHADQSLWS